jgi:hypothetical protein
MFHVFLSVEGSPDFIKYYLQNNFQYLCREIREVWNSCISKHLDKGTLVENVKENMKCGPEKSEFNRNFHGLPPQNPHGL